MGPDTVNQSSHARMFLPAVAVMIFITMVAIAEYQIRSSSKWPLPPCHEVGGWQVDDPPLWTLAGCMNLPATVPILWMSSLSDGFTHALDDHDLIVYVPWSLFVLAVVLCRIPRRSACRQTCSELNATISCFLGAGVYYGRADLFRDRKHQPNTCRSSAKNSNGGRCVFLGLGSGHDHWLDKPHSASRRLLSVQPLAQVSGCLELLLMVAKSRFP